MNVRQKQKAVKVFNRLFNEADTTNMSVKRLVEISEAIDLVKNLHITNVGSRRELLIGYDKYIEFDSETREDRIDWYIKNRSN